MPAKPKSVKAVKTPEISSMAKPAKTAMKKSQPIKAAAVTKKSAKTKPSKGKAAETTAAITKQSGTASASPRIMLDLETFGNTPGAVIVSIGAVKFDETGITDRFECRIDPESCVRHGLKLDASAVVWWLKQSAKARAAISKSKGLALPQALEKFAAWVGNPKTEIWGQGSDFDNVLLAAAYRACDMEPPWFYGFNRCYRTISRMHRTDVPFQGVADAKAAHTALADAEAQALHLIEILKKCYGSKLSE